MVEVGGVLESLVVYRQKGFMAYDFHIHWKTIHGKQGCYVKSISETLLNGLKGSTLARVGLSDQALTGNPQDNGTEARIILNFQRDLFGKLVSSLDLSGTIHVMATVPGLRAPIEIPISDHEFEHESMNPSHIADEDLFPDEMEGLPVYPEDLPE